MIEARALTKRYDDKLAVDELTVTIRPGIVTGFLGPKRVRQVDNDANDPRPRPPHHRKVDHRRLPLPQAAHDAAPPRSARSSAKAVHGGRQARSHLLLPRPAVAVSRRARVDEGTRRGRAPRTWPGSVKGFSLGIGQRLGIAAALLGDPQVLLFDEPVNGLDPRGHPPGCATLMKASRGRGPYRLLSSHLMSEMALTADHLIVIGRGRLLARPADGRLHPRCVRRVRPRSDPRARPPGRAVEECWCPRSPYLTRSTGNGVRSGAPR